MDRNDPFVDWQQHKTPRDVAMHMRTVGQYVGRKYRTAGDVWEAPKEILVIGLLHLILDELQKTNEHEERMEEHRIWMQCYYKKAKRLKTAHERECSRISKLCDLKLLGRDVSSLSMHQLEDYGWRTILGERIKRLRQVKTLDDITKLSGVGKKTAEKIRHKMKAK